LLQGHTAIALGATIGFGGFANADQTVNELQYFGQADQGQFTLKSIGLV